MRFKFVVGLRACAVAVALILSAVDAAETRSNPLMGASRAQVLAELGEPRSSIVAGAREVLRFDRQRVVLRNNVVVEVEFLPAEPVRSAPSGPAPAADDEAASDGDAPQEQSDEIVTPAVPQPPPAADAPLQIRVLRPGAVRSQPAAERKSEPEPAAPEPMAGQATPSSPTPSASVPEEATTPAASAADVSSGTAASAEPSSSTPAAADQDAAPASERERAEEAPAEEAESESAEEPAETAAAPARSTPPVDAEPEVLTTSSYVIAFVIVAGGVAYLAWRARQRRLELAATAVSRTPFAAPAATESGARFTPELLARLEWKRFEELVAAYYGKTGVVAVRTKCGPASPVHIKISWKGESRPFAFVHCIAHPTGLVQPNSIQELVSALAAEDIRRGYVVTSGKFGVPARDLAEEKNITLLPGDIFLEKLNALPDSARNELMQEVAIGDISTPSCPVCEGRMSRAPEDPALWRCPSHPEATIPAWK